MEKNSYAIGLAIGEHGRRLTDLEGEVARLRQDHSDLRTWLQRCAVLAAVWAWPLLVPLAGDDLAKAAAKALKTMLRIG